MSVKIWHLLFCSQLVPLLSGAQETESFISSHSGKIRSGLIMRLEATSAMVGRGEPSGGCGISYDNLHDIHNECVNYCKDHLGGLAELLKLTVVYHVLVEDGLKDSETPFVSLDLAEEDSLIDGLESIRKQFFELSSEIDSVYGLNYLVDSMYYSLLHLDENIQFVNKEQNIKIKLLRNLALGGRKKQVELVSKRYDRHFHCGDLQGNHDLSITIEFFDEYCQKYRGGNDICNCIRSVQDEVRGYNWSQDLFFAQNNNGNSTLRHQFVREPSNRALFNSLAESVSYQAGVDANTCSAFEWKGGNMLVSDKYLFLGRNILEKYVGCSNGEACKEVLRTIGIEDYVNRIDSEDITSAIAKISGKNVVWVGTADSKRNYWVADSSKDCFHQPMFHIDLFLSILKYDEGAQGTTLTYLLGVPGLDNCYNREKAIQTLGRNSNKFKRLEWQVEQLGNHVIESADAMDRQLKMYDSNLEINRITIPLPTSFDLYSDSVFTINKYFSYCNGLVENYDDRVVFWIPNYPTCKYDRFASRFYEETCSKLNSNNIIVQEIPGVYENNAALHCTLLVTDRE